MIDDGSILIFKDHESNKLAGICTVLFVYAEDNEMAMLDILTSSGKRIEQIVIKKEEIEIGRNNDTKDGQGSADNHERD